MDLGFGDLSLYLSSVPNLRCDLQRSLTSLGLISSVNGNETNLVLIK